MVQTAGWALTLAMIAGSLGVHGGPPDSQVTPVRHRVPCSSGLVALTFDDGPSAKVTPTLLRHLREKKVRATFFMVGQRVASAHATTRQVARAGHVIANHSWAHTIMTSQSDGQIRETLAATRRELRAAGVRPSNLMRPPYGGTNGRVNATIRGAGYVPVLWDIDTRDWERRSAQTIADTVIRQLRPHASNVVLQHDGIANSPNSAAAVPQIIRRARGAGYCFGALGPDGRPAPPVPRMTARVVGAFEGHDVRVLLRLDEPTTRPTSLLLATRPGTAAAKDFAGRRVRVVIPAGRVQREVRIRAFADRLDEPREGFWIRFSHPSGLRIGTRARPARIFDRTPAPAVSVADITASRSLTGPITVPVPVRLGTASGRTVRVTLRTLPGTALPGRDFVAQRRTVLLRPGATNGTFAVPVKALPADPPATGPTTLRVEISAAVNARVVKRFATVILRPPG